MSILIHENKNTVADRETFIPTLLSRVHKLKAGSCMLAIILAAGLLFSCTHAPTPAAQSPQIRQSNAPRPGDTRMIDGVEYVYGKNVRYMTNPTEPEYTWVRKDQYFPDTDERSRSLALKTAKQQEAGDAPQKPASGKDEAERNWTNFGEDGNRTQYFYDKDTVAYPAKDLVRIWKKREFPSGSSQKQIVTLDEIDCREARYHSVEVRVTYPDGTTRTFGKVTPWSKVYENSPEDYLMGQYCK